MAHPPEAALADLRALLAECDACEVSWSLSATGCETRALLYADHSVDSALRLARLAVALGYPQALLSDWSRALPGADAIGIGINAGFTSVRLYAQYWEALVQRVETGDLSPAPLYAGFKALPDGTTRIDPYICLPLAPAQTYWPPLAAGLSGLGLDPSAIATAFAALTPEKAIFTVTDEQHRRSWLLTLRRAAIAGPDLAAAFAPLERHPQAEPILTAARAGQTLAHIAAGEDATKGTFLTFYFESDPAQVMALLSATTPAPGSHPPPE